MIPPGMIRRVERALFVLPLLLLAPLETSACPLCIAAQDKNVQIAYMIASAFMTFLPLGLIGGLIYALRRRARLLELEREAGVVRLPSADERAKTAA